MVRAGLEIYACGSQRNVPELVLEIAHWHATVEAPYGKTVPEHMWMDTVPILTRFVLALDLLQPRPGCNAIKNILDLPRGDMPLTIARKQPALGTPGEQLLQDLGDLGQQDHSARLFELGIGGLDVQVSFVKIYILCPDLGHLTHSETRSGQQEQGTSLTVVLGSI
jgi:hypothetical protein